MHLFQSADRWHRSGDSPDSNCSGGSAHCVLLLLQKDAKEEHS